MLAEAFPNDEGAAPLKPPGPVGGASPPPPATFRNDEVAAPLKPVAGLLRADTRYELSATMKLRPH